MPERGKKGYFAESAVSKKGEKEREKGEQKKKNWGIAIRNNL